jgi:hypothetical protein
MSRISTQARDPSAPLESVLDLLLADLGAAADLHDVVAHADRSDAGRSGARRSGARRSGASGSAPTHSCSPAPHWSRAEPFGSADLIRGGLVIA